MFLLFYDSCVYFRCYISLLTFAFFLHLSSDEMKDEYLTKRFSNSELAANIVRHYKRVPMLHILARHPYTCWMVGKLFSYAYSSEGYGRNPPKLTPFLLNILIVLLSRRQQFYNYVRDYEVVMFINPMAFFGQILVL